MTCTDSIIIVAASALLFVWAVQALAAIGSWHHRVTKARR